jgi:hypothetical protein
MKAEQLAQYKVQLNLVQNQTFISSTKYTACIKGRIRYIFKNVQLNVNRPFVTRTFNKLKAHEY